MKKFKYLFTALLLFTLVFQSCEDIEEVETPDFQVNYNMKAKVGEPVEFKVENAPNFLYFYAGDAGHKYKFRERTNAEGAVTMSFKNAQKYGLGENKKNTLSVLVSTDYDGSSSISGVANATWTDISDRFTISEDYTFDWTESGIADITDLENGSPIYFAYKFLSKGDKSNGNRQPEWRVDDFSIVLAEDDAPAPLTVANMDIPGWNTVDVEGVVDSFNTSKWYFTNGYWRFRGGPATYANEDWLVTNGINLTKVSPDKGEALKTYSEKLERFSYTYSKPGTYTITLIGNNTTVHGDKKVIKEYTIDVE